MIYAQTVLLALFGAGAEFAFAAPGAPWQGHPGGGYYWPGQHGGHHPHPHPPPHGYSNTWTSTEVVSATATVSVPASSTSIVSAGSTAVVSASSSPSIPVSSISWNSTTSLVSVVGTGTGTPYSIGTSPYSVGTSPHSVGTSPYSVGTSSYSIGTSPYSNGTSAAATSSSGLLSGAVSSTLLSTGAAVSTGAASSGWLSSGVASSGWLSTGAASSSWLSTGVASTSSIVSKPVAPLTTQSLPSSLIASTYGSSTPASSSSASASTSIASSAPESSSSTWTSSSSVVVTSSSADASTTVASRDIALAAAAKCTFTEAAAAMSSAASCSTIVLDGIDVPAGTTLAISPKEGSTVIFSGETTFGYKEWDGPLLQIEGTDLTITGTSGHSINGNGAKWWDGKGTNNGKTKPQFFYAHSLIDSTISDLNIVNTPVQAISIYGCTNLKVNDVTINNSAGDEDELGHNTDCFDIGDSTGVYISGAVCENQDDCVAINSVTDFEFTGGTCSGGHGLSVGGVGGYTYNTVENVYFGDSTVKSSMNGVRIKTDSGTTGSVTNVTYSGITLSEISDYGIVIEQDYENGSPTGKPTSGVPVKEVYLSGITGTVEDSAIKYYILCASCSDFKIEDVDLTGGTDTDVNKCKGVPSGASSLC